MNIISGIFKSIKIKTSKDLSYRPTKSLVRKSIFDSLNYFNFNSVCDLFSGTGSFGIECISRGAKKVVFFENYPEALEILKKNLNLFKNINNHEIYNKNFFDFFLSNTNFDLKFDIIFIDPPYRETKINEIINIIFEKKLLIQNGILIIHRHKKDDIKISNKLNILEDRSYGISKILFGN